MKFYLQMPNVTKLKKKNPQNQEMLPTSRNSADVKKIVQKI
jgi:hypothetical protein